MITIKLSCGNIDCLDADLSCCDCNSELGEINHKIIPCGAGIKWKRSEEIDKGCIDDQ